MTTQIKNIY